MINTQLVRLGLPTLLLALLSLPAAAQSFRVQCPTSTITHPIAANNNAEPAYNGPTTLVAGPNGYLVPSTATNATPPGGAIKCQQIGGGDGYSSMADGTQTYMFSFGPLSGLADMASGNPGTEFPNIFNTIYPGTFAPGDPATTDGATDYNGAGGGPGYLANYNVGGTQAFTFNGAVGLIPDADCLAGNTAAAIAAGACGGAGGLDGHVDPRQIEDVGVMNGNIPAPLMAIDEDDEFFLTLTNTGMIMRPDLFEQHTVHFHGYPNASSVYDGVPDASVAINIGGSFTYYYLAPDAGTYFWHCHITPPEHLQMGMVGQLYVRPRQNRTPVGTDVYQTSLLQQKDLRTACFPNLPTAANQPGPDILCSVPLPAADVGFKQGTDSSGNGFKYVYNDGDGSTRYDIDVPLQIHGFDPNFHFVGMTFNPEGFADMKDKYFLLNGRSYPDTVGVPGYAGGPSVAAATAAGSPDVSSGAIGTEDSDGRTRFSQPLPTLITLDSHGGPGGTGQRALLRIADLDVTEY